MRCSVLSFSITAFVLPPISHRVTFSCHRSTPCPVYFCFVLNTLVIHLTFLLVVSPAPTRLAWCWAVPPGLQTLGRQVQSPPQLWQAHSCSSGWHSWRKQWACPRGRSWQQVPLIFSPGAHASLILMPKSAIVGEGRGREDQGICPAFDIQWWTRHKHFPQGS